MGKIKRVFLDIDGILANWSKSACEATGIVYPTDFEFPSQEWLASRIGVKQIQKSCENFEFWSNLEKYPWSDEIVKTVSQSGKEWRFLTKPMKTSHCFSGKAEWMFRHYPHYWDKLWIVTGSKSATCRNEGDLLIDDFDKNINEWKDAGGSVFHWKEITDDYTGDWKSRIQKLKEVIYAD